MKFSILRSAGIALILGSFIISQEPAATAQEKRHIGTERNSQPNPQPQWGQCPGKSRPRG
jgi:hypothetical protein